MQYSGNPHFVTLNKLDLKVGKKSEIRKRFQDYQTYIFIVCWSYPMMLVDSQIIINNTLSHNKESSNTIFQRLGS